MLHLLARYNNNGFVQNNLDWFGLLYSYEGNARLGRAETVSAGRGFI